MSVHRDRDTLHHLIPNCNLQEKKFWPVQKFHELFKVYELWDRPETWPRNRNLAYSRWTLMMPGHIDLTIVKFNNYCQVYASSESL